ncbi:hypothetical protein G7Y89_g6444 [Cudoniella acicularis]|uniref:Uncharacterized protein n=1 Tax=Cudoniella acicularis TaxID=354080 RepID=A0A8H4RNU7_9HELO|nr:hypothetical protein G7Y89_g6444 [Cudoniella acicularis]
MSNPTTSTTNDGDDSSEPTYEMYPRIKLGTHPDNSQFTVYFWAAKRKTGATQLKYALYAEGPPFGTLGRKQPSNAGVTFRMKRLNTLDPPFDRELEPEINQERNKVTERIVNDKLAERYFSQEKLPRDKWRTIRQNNPTTTSSTHTATPSSIHKSTGRTQTSVRQQTDKEQGSSAESSTFLNLKDASPSEIVDAWENGKLDWRRINDDVGVEYIQKAFLAEFGRKPEGRLIRNTAYDMIQYRKEKPSETFFWPMKRLALELKRIPKKDEAKVLARQPSPESILPNPYSEDSYTAALASILPPAKPLETLLVDKETDECRDSKGPLSPDIGVLADIESLTEEPPPYSSINSSVYPTL